MMKYWVVVCLLAAVSTAQGDLIAIDPELGWSGYFYWEDEGEPGPLPLSLDGIQTSEYRVARVDGAYIHLDPWTSGDGFWAWSIAATVDSVMASLSTRDMYIAGDEFSLIVNGVTVPWTSAYKDTQGYFHAEYRNLLLPVGEHIITFGVTAVATATYGSAPVQFSPTQVVPVPGGTLLAVVGLGTGGWLSRRRRR